METLLLEAAKKPKPVMIQRCRDGSERAQKPRDAASLPSTRSSMMEYFWSSIGTSLVFFMIQ